MFDPSVLIVVLFASAIIIILYLLIQIRIDLQRHTERLSIQQSTSQKLQNNVCDILNSTNTYLSQILDCTVQNNMYPQVKVEKPKKYKPKKFV